MRVGVPREIKDHEYRVGLVPSSVAELVRHGHDVLVECGAGIGAGLDDDLYAAAGEELHRFAAQFPGVRTIFSTHDALAHVLRRADLLVGAVLVPGAAARSSSPARWRPQ